MPLPELLRYTFGSGVVGGAAGFLLKSVWDRFWKRKDELEDLRRTKNLELIERQLSNFYWPLYFRLQKDNAVWSRLLDRDIRKDDQRRKVAETIEKDLRVC